AWAPATIDVYPCLKWWDEPDWTYADPFADPCVAWDIAGAQKPNDDRGGLILDPCSMGDRYYYSMFNNENYDDGEPFEFPLDAALVQSWVDDPNSNLGVILTMNLGAVTDVTFSSSNDGTITERPLLTVTTGMLVPYVIGQLYDTAVGIISDEGFTVGDVRYEYNEADPCYVFEQDPCSGSLEIGASIALWVSRGPQPTPDYNGDNVVDTLDLILLAGEWLKCEDVTTDLTDDGCIDMSDFAVFAAAWMEVTIVADISGNGCVGIEDLAVMAQQWLTCEETNTADLFDGQDGGCVNMLDYAIMSQQWGLGLCDGP
ncbi:MAG: hypothetical protein KAJ46_00250, partial [Sedimentisphaerales bacterium]|nr:hypothetical protein [Sedimentisphaerales bacterium]